MNISESLTCDDVLLVPRYSETLPHETDLVTSLTRNISINIPFMSAAMDTVTEDKMAIAMALEGGIGIIHKNCTPDRQQEMVALVKRFENGFIREPIVISPQYKISNVIAIRQKYGFKAIPVTEDGTIGTKVVGMITRNDYLLKHSDQHVSERMVPLSELLTASEPITLKQANSILSESKYSQIVVLKKDGTLSSLLSRRDLEKNDQYPHAAKDNDKRLRVGAAVGPAADRDERIEKLVQAGVDVLVVDTAHGHSAGVINTVKYIKKTYPAIDVIAGNIATGEAAKDLIAAGADGLKVGIGPGSICTTRIISGVGVPQLSAVMEVSSIAKPEGVPVIADGGIKYSGDVVKLLAGGAQAVMIGSLLAGTTDSPGELIYSQGKTYKYYRGMGSLAAMKKGGKERYAQSHVADEKLVPEGIEGKLLLKGSTSDEIFQLQGGLRSGLGYNGAKNIVDLQKKAKFTRITSAGLKESHVHDVTVLNQAPNYK